MRCTRLRNAITTACVLAAAPALAEDRMICGPNGDGPCEQSGLETFLRMTGSVITGFYGLVDRIGWPAVLIVSALAIAFGVRLNGSPASVTRTYRNDILIKTEHQEAVPASAVTDGGHRLGYALKFFGYLFFVFAMVSCSNHVADYLLR